MDGVEGFELVCLTAPPSWAVLLAYLGNRPFKWNTESILGAERTDGGLFAGPISPIRGQYVQLTSRLRSNIVFHNPIEAKATEVEILEARVLAQERQLVDLRESAKIQQKLAPSILQTTHSLFKAKLQGKPVSADLEVPLTQAMIQWAAREETPRAPCPGPAAQSYSNLSPNIGWGYCSIDGTTFTASGDGPDTQDVLQCGHRPCNPDGTLAHKFIVVRRGAGWQALYKLRESDVNRLTLAVADEAICRTVTSDFDNIQELLKKEASLRQPGPTQVQVARQNQAHRRFNRPK